MESFCEVLELGHWWSLRIGLRVKRKQGESVAYK